MYLYVMFPISNTGKFVSEMYEPSTEKNITANSGFQLRKIKKNIRNDSFG